MVNEAVRRQRMPDGRSIPDPSATVGTARGGGGGAVKQVPLCVADAQGVRPIAYPRAMASPAPIAPSISLTVSTIQGWPAIKANVESVQVAARRVGGEVIVTDGSGNAPPPPNVLDPTTTWTSIPGSSVFQLRDVAYRLASGPIVAITEDHCRVPPDWGTRMVEAHARHPEAVAIGGSVENGATGSVVDWASFLVVQTVIASPIASGPAQRIAGAVNVSYKRDGVYRIDDFDGLGALDVLHQRALKGSGGSLVADDSIRVVHDQPLSLDETIRIHFHAGRTFAGFLRRRMDRQAKVRLMGVLLIPYVRFARAVSVGAQKGYGPVLARAWPMMLLLYLVQAAGHVAGFASGPSDSPRRVQ